MLGQASRSGEPDDVSGAKVVADALEITLTTRNGVPMCGFPMHSAGRYVDILEAAGHRVVLA